MTDRNRLDDEFSKISMISLKREYLYSDIIQFLIKESEIKKHTPYTSYPPEVDLLNSGCDVLEEIGIIILRYQRLYMLFDFVPANPSADKSRLDVIKRIFSFKKKLEEFVEKKIEEKENKRNDSIYACLFTELFKIMEYFMHIKWWKYDAPKKHNNIKERTTT